MKRKHLAYYYVLVWLLLTIFLTLIDDASAEPPTGTLISCDCEQPTTFYIVTDGVEPFALCGVMFADNFEIGSTYGPQYITRGKP